MAVISKYRLDGVESTPPREWKNLEINLDYTNESVQPNINFSELSFVNEANEIVKSWFNSNIGAIEGQPIDITISNGGNTYNVFDGYLDWSTYSVKSPVECSIGLVKQNGLNALDTRAKGITMRLLESKNLLPTSLGVNVPYVVENRKTNLEKIQLSFATFMAFKSVVDEVFKLIAIAADLTSGGAAQAIINLATTVANLTLLIQKLVELIKEMQDTFFPPIRLHRGIKIKDFIIRGLVYCGYNTVNFGSINTLLDGVVLLPHKRDEVGANAGQFGGQSTSQSGVSGILKPTDYGYTLSEAFDLLNKLFDTKIAIINNVVYIMPQNDVNWQLNTSYSMPNVLIEQAFYQNGIKSYNVDEMVSRTLISYLLDDSDKWTLTSVNDSITEVIREPNVINDSRNVLLTGLENIEIPYALGLRYGELPPLYNKLIDLFDTYNNIIGKINDAVESMSTFLGIDLFEFETLSIDIESRSSSLKIENHFFSVPKIVYLENGYIPSNYLDKIGTNALYDNYHSYKSFVPGVKDPNNLNNTNQKVVYSGVKIPFSYNDFVSVLNNSYFQNQNGETCKFTKINYNVDGDYAIIDYFCYKNYLTNIKETVL